MNPQSAYEHRTEKLYEDDGLMTEFDAQVISCESNEKGFLVELGAVALVLGKAVLRILPIQLVADPITGYLGKDRGRSNGGH